MDIFFDTSEGIFNFRVAAIIEHNKKYLITDYKDKGYLSLIGGRTKIGESSIETIRREVLEETGYEVKNTKILGVVENFFDLSKKNYHEILILIKVDFDENFYKQEKIKCLDKDDVYFTWKSIEELKKENLQPSTIIDYLNKEDLFHLINKD